MNRLKIVLRFRVRAWQAKADRWIRRWRRIGAPTKLVQLEFHL